MGRVEVLEAQVGELEAELRVLLDEYVEVQGRLRTLETVTDVDTEQAGARAVADLPERLQAVAASSGDDANERGASATDDARTTSASQEEVAAAVERVESVDDDPHGADDGEGDADAGDSDEDDLGDIIVG